ncbi:MAG: SUMF1/EgtB/PvdO family nonheme iron enzyme [Symploca sp. SIO2E9]|nr:SUMF1/EgtB/PvdO family nonheme iron enzyme [Symploca sp. SIO2E9]
MSDHSALARRANRIQIFLAHASEDKPQVLKLYERLRAKGYKPWLDKKDLIARQNWREEIPKAIKQSQIFIACLSNNSVRKQGYVTRELRLALNIYAERVPGTIYLIPLKLEDCEVPALQQAEYGISLQDIQWLDYWEADGFENLLRAIKYQFPTHLTTTSGEEKALGLPLSTVEFETVRVDAKGEVVKGEPNRKAKIVKEDLGNGISLEMVEIPGGSFKMGSPAWEKGRYKDESPQHDVKVPTFFMGRFEVTQEQYQQVMGKNPSRFKGNKRPVERVSWNEAMEFCKRLNQNQAERSYSLPSEAQWEYACRAGEKTPFHCGKTITDKLANYDAIRTYASEPAGKYRRETTPVGSFPANGFGLYDMHGNVWEWCFDDWHNNYKGAPTDGSAWIGGTGSNDIKVLRGGSWLYYPVFCRCASRHISNFGRVDVADFIGFRVVCVGARTM